MTGQGDLAAFLAALGLEKYAEVFADNEVDLAALAHLSDDDLKELGLPLGPRRKIVAALRDTPAVTPSLAPAAPEGERRVAAVLFADLVGYTALTNRRDAEDIHTLLQGFFAMADRQIEEHGGRVDKHIGDCVMGVFGAPKAHGNDTERAVRAALAIREGMKPLALELKEQLDVHIGIAAGHVIASSTGSAVHSEYTVTGDTVNLASRLAGEAGAGEVVVSDRVWQGLAQKLDGASLGPREIDGFRGSQEIWRVTRWHGAQHATPMIGRQLELQQLRSVLEACRTTGRGASILIRGEAGIGKTRFMEEVAATARELGYQGHAGQVVDFGAETDRDAIQTLVRGMIATGIASADAEDQVFINELTGAPQPPEMRLLLDAMDIPAREEGLRRTLSRLVERASHDQPLLLIVEDLHWAKRHTLNGLAIISAALSQCPAILVMTSRFENDPIDHGWRARAGATSLSTIDLAPLNSEEAVALATPFIEANAEFVRLCIARAAGNPLFLDQLLKNMVEGESFFVPQSIQSLVQARLDRLDPASKAIVQAASALGQRFDGKALGHMLGSSGEVPDALLGKFIVPQQGPGFMFQHALIRDAVYGSLLKSRKNVLHRRAAEWFENRDPELVAEHLDLADAPEAPAAYLAAARAHAAANHYEQASRATNRGLELCKTNIERFALLKLKGDILHDTGNMPDALACFDTALTSAATEADRCRALIGRAQVKRVIDDLDGAFADLAAAEPIVVAEGLKIDEARLRFLRGNLYFPRGDIDGCVREHGRSLELAREAQSVEHETAALGGLADSAYIRGRLVTAHRLFDDCVRLSQEHGLHRTEVANRPMVAITGWYAGKAKAAFAEALEAISSAARIGHHRAEMIGQHAAWFLTYSRGHFAEALAHAERALILARQIKARRFEAEALAFRGETLRASGRRPEALPDIEQALEISRETGMAYMGAIYWSLLARATEDEEVRAEALKSGEALLATNLISHNHLLFRMFAIDVSLESGNWAEAERYAADLETYTAQEPLPWAEFYISRGRLLAQAGRGDGNAGLKGRATALIAQSRTLGLELAAKELKEVLRLLPLAGEEGSHVT